MIRRQLMLTLNWWNYECDVWASLTVSFSLAGAKSVFPLSPPEQRIPLLGTNTVLLVIGLYSLMFAYMGKDERESPYHLVAVGGFVAFVLIVFWSKLELFLKKKSGGGDPSQIHFIQRAGTTLNLHVHIHAVVSDGVFLEHRGVLGVKSLGFRWTGGPEVAFEAALGGGGEQEHGCSAVEEEAGEVQGRGRGKTGLLGGLSGPVRIGGLALT